MQKLGVNFSIYFSFDLLELNDATVTIPFPKKMPDFDIFLRWKAGVIMIQRWENSALQNLLGTQIFLIKNSHQIHVLSCYYYTPQYKHMNIVPYLLHKKSFKFCLHEIFLEFIRSVLSFQ